MQFNLKESLNEVVNLAKYKASIMGIKIKFQAQFQGDFDHSIKFDELKKSFMAIDDNIENHPILIKVSKLTNFQQLPTCVIGDCKRLKQVCLNMIQNAINYTFEGSIIINAHYDIESRQIIFIITDQGIGLTVDE